MEYEQFDRRLARECAKAFSQSTGLGCTLSDKTGRAFDEYGYGCESCGMCAAAGASHDRCVQAHIYGMTEAERFGGKYIYFCPMGLTCFVSPILGEGGAEAKITVGPFIMVEKQDFIACELTENVRLTEAQKQAAVQVLENIPFVPTERVTQLSVLLFMAVGFMNNVSAENRMMESGHSEELQGQITSYILELKQEEAPPPYPFEKEHVLLQCVARKDRDGARRLLNELLGAILFVDGGDMELVKSRTAIENGADAEHTMRLSHEYRYRIGAFTTIDSLCLWLAGVVNHFMDDLFRFSDAKHANIIHRCTQYISANYKERITLEDTARMVYLSPAYLSRIFKQETGVTVRLLYLESFNTTEKPEQWASQLLESLNPPANTVMLAVASHDGNLVVVVSPNSDEWLRSQSTVDQLSEAASKPLLDQQAGQGPNWSQSAIDMMDAIASAKSTATTHAVSSVSIIVMIIVFVVLIVVVLVMIFMRRKREVSEGSKQTEEVGKTRNDDAMQLDNADDDLDVTAMAPEETSEQPEGKEAQEPNPTSEASGMPAPRRGRHAAAPHDDERFKRPN